MIRKPSYKQFLNADKPAHSSISLNAPPDPLPSSRPFDTSPLTKHKHHDRLFGTGYLQVVKYIPDDPRKLRHTCFREPASGSQSDSFSISPQLNVSRITKEKTPTKQTRPSSNQQAFVEKPKVSFASFASNLDFSQQTSKGWQKSSKDALQGRTLGQSKSSAKLGWVRSEEDIEKEIEKLKQLRHRRMQNNVDIFYRFENKLNPNIDPPLPKSPPMPKSVLNLSFHDLSANNQDRFNKERSTHNIKERPMNSKEIPAPTLSKTSASNKENRVVTATTKNLDLSANDRDKSKTPTKQSIDVAIFSPIQFRKKPSMNQNEKKVAIEATSKPVISRDSVLTAATNRESISSYSPPETARFQRPSLKKLELADFAIGKKLGEGRFGSVSVAVHRATGAIFALKKIPKATIRQNMMVDQFLLEAKTQLFVDHSYVVRLFGLFDDQDNIYLLLEYLEGGTLYAELKRSPRGKLSQVETSAKMRMICEAVGCLHQKGIAHRDIKPENIIIASDVCKLADFGWATRCDQRRKTYCGTTDYVAPQIVEGLEYDISVDLWGVGVLAYELLAGRAPFYHISRQETFNKIKNVDSSTLTYPEGFSTEAVDFIGRLIKKDPEERMEMWEALQHPFITKYHL